MRGSGSQVAEPDQNSLQARSCSARSCWKPSAAARSRVVLARAMASCRDGDVWSLQSGLDGIAGSSYSVLTAHPLPDFRRPL
jgi:hypothetical protein